ncbi:hypothetical protein HYH02_014324 [Chlamydomonas schloesseri]|uniref:Transcription factor Iwr1 domain-containing protein n=1 Tax=Chlamydomonas schloesseri TaxID=2026947 RepID=A0A835VWN4_9CHLO|nr:hypothetical protein HYH02_014324 [Chlamydomonas schloesseri]|eukprot:KAG2428623.1 hypothetical protein HYH02_014324 [Chlamydomonas schloesseri]
MTALALALLVGLTRVGKGLNGVGKGLNGVGKGLTNIGRGLKAGMQGLGEKSFAAKGSTLQAAASDVGAEAARTAFPMGLRSSSPCTQVAEEDDEFFWAGEVEAEAAQRAAALEEHDSKDSNAESYYANSYPDEDDVPYDDDLGDADCGGGGGGGC